MACFILTCMYIKQIRTIVVLGATHPVKFYWNYHIPVEKLCINLIPGTLSITIRISPQLKCLAELKQLLDFLERQHYICWSSFFNELCTRMQLQCLLVHMSSCQVRALTGKKYAFQPCPIYLLVNNVKSLKSKELTRHFAITVAWELRIGKVTASTTRLKLCASKCFILWTWFDYSV